MWKKGSLNHINLLILFQAKALGRVLFEQVCKQLHLLEADYFGLEYQDLAGTRVRDFYNFIKKFLHYRT